MVVVIRVSVGELLDKLTILRIKVARISDPEKLQNVRREKLELEDRWAQIQCGLRNGGQIALLVEELQGINESLWDVEDRLRESEAAANFGTEFVALARQVYFTNDRRAAVKRQINVLLGSELVEEKQYAEY